MDRRKGIKWILGSVLAVVLVTASAAVPNESAASQAGALCSPWEVNTFTNAFYDTGMSTTFFGPYQYPLIVTYNTLGYVNVKIKSGLGLNCGPDDEWACFS